jgi:hypothetical protein
LVGHTKEITQIKWSSKKMLARCVEYMFGIEKLHSDFDLS